MKNAKLAIYGFLVNRHSGIAERYHRFHDKAHGSQRILSWFYLLWLNLCYYVFMCRFLGRRKAAEPYESAYLPVKESESSRYMRRFRGVVKMAGKKVKLYPAPHTGKKLADCFLEVLMGYDVISFDVFDTLIFRPFDDPTDVFYILGHRAGILDFNEKRKLAERRARMKRMSLCGDMEIGLSDIWDILSADTGIPVENGERWEEEAELSLCYANPFMSEIWSKLLEAGKKIVVTTDMYLPVKTIEAILAKNGFTGYEKIFLSNEYHKSKAVGDLYGILRQVYPSEHILHVGDNVTSDVEHPVRYGIDAVWYPNVNEKGSELRPFDMSPMVGGAYRGLVNAAIYNCREVFCQAYEYGFIYGGLFVTGYCSFIRHFVEEQGLERVLFLSRDGDILKQAYDILYPGNDSAYAYWSRKAATKLTASFDREDYFRRFLFHKAGQGVSVREALVSMELEEMAGRLEDLWDADDQASQTLLSGIMSRMSREYRSEAPQGTAVYPKPDDELTAGNAWFIRCMLEELWDEVIAAYAGQSEAAGNYYRKLCKGISGIAVVDIGWAGSGARALDLMMSRVWGMEIRVCSVNAGTNTLYNAEPDASESFLITGDMVSYLYSPGFNRDLYKKHDPGKDYNVYWEQMLSSPTPQFLGFQLPDGTGHDTSEAGWRLCFGEKDPNVEGIRQIQMGILDFVRMYEKAFRDHPEMLDISGRDAYAPMLLASSHGERYLKAVTRAFHINKNI